MNLFPNKRAKDVVRMLNDQEFNQWCEENKVSKPARAHIEQVRTTEPSRRVQSGAGNVPVRYASRKMGFTIQAESHTNELPAVYEKEHDAGTLEYFDQPPPIKLQYQAKNGRNIGVLHTADFFCIESNGAGWEEWKTEEHLLELAEKMPNRFVRSEDGTWRCPPGEKVAAAYGFFYRVRSSAQICWIYQRNIRFLEDYLRDDCPPVKDAVKERVVTLVFENPGITLDELLKRGEGASSDDIYTLLATEQIYADLSAAPLTEPERVHVFCDQETAQAWAVMLVPAGPTAIGGSRMVHVQAGAPIVWDERRWTILNTGETTISLLAEDNTLIELPRVRFEALVTQGKLVGIEANSEAGKISTVAQERLSRASRDDLRKANQRYALIKPALDGQSITTSKVPMRTLRFWAAKYRKDAQTCGSGYIGLLPEVYACGNRTPRLSEETVKAVKDFIEKDYETHKQKYKYEVYGALVQACHEQGITSPSYKTFIKLVYQRPRYQQVLKRAGRRAAYQHEPMYWELSMTTPRHGERPFEIGHLDSTQLDIELVDTHGQNLGRPWLTLLMDAFSRRIVALYLTFDPPSYRSGMMVIRECVRRYGRLFQFLIVDGGLEFGSVYFEMLLARYECSKKTRPGAKPRFGSVIERLFGTLNTTFIHNLAGNTQMTKNVRQVTKSVDPRGLAAWTLGTLFRRLCEWAYEVYDIREHPALGQSPRAAFAEGMLQSGQRPHRLIPYDDDFLMCTLPTTKKGTAKIQPNRGVKINYILYWSEAFRDPEVENSRVPVRYDPFDVGHAFAFVKGRWVECISEHYARFKGRSEREILLASEELRKSKSRHAQQFTLSALIIANFLSSAEGEEATLTQHRRDEEAKAVAAQMGGKNKRVEDAPPREPAASVGREREEPDLLSDAEDGEDEDQDSDLDEDY